MGVVLAREAYSESMFVMDAPPTGRKPKKVIGLHPPLAQAFRYVAKMERKEHSDLLKEMFELWLKKQQKQGKYKKVKLEK